MTNPHWGICYSDFNGDLGFAIRHFPSWTASVRQVRFALPGTAFLALTGLLRPIML